MPTLVWIRRPESGTSAAGGGSNDTSRRELAIPAPVESAAAAAAPDSVISAVYKPNPDLAVSSGVALPADSSKQCCGGGKERERKRKLANPAIAAKKQSKATSASDRDLPQGVFKVLSGKFKSRIHWDGKTSHIGTFDTPEQASAAYMSMKKDLLHVKRSALSADEVDIVLDTSQKKAVEAAGGSVAKKRKLPTGVHDTKSGKFKSQTKWGGKTRYIGTFDTPEQASAAIVAAKKHLAHANLSAVSSGEVDALFDAAKKKALKTVQSMNVIC